MLAVALAHAKPRSSPSVLETRGSETHWQRQGHGFRGDALGMQIQGLQLHQEPGTNPKLGCNSQIRAMLA